MSENGKTQNIPPGLLYFNKAFRFFAIILFIIFIISFISGILDIIFNFDNIDVSLPGIFGILIPAFLFWKIPDWLIKIHIKHFVELLTDPSKEIQSVNVEGNYSKIDYMEITDKGSREKYITEDSSGRVVFDSTSRPLRLVFGGAFLLIGIIIGGSIILFSDDPGFFEYIWLGGWVLFCLVSIGYVYEVTINKTAGTADRKAGWFFFVFKSRFRLSDFSEIVVSNTFYRDHYDSARSYHPRSRDPKFNVYLIGTRVLRLKLFSHLTDARHMGEELSAHLKLPLKEKSDILV